MSSFMTKRKFFEKYTFKKLIVKVQFPDNKHFD